MATPKKFTKSTKGKSTRSKSAPASGIDSCIHMHAELVIGSGKSCIACMDCGAILVSY